MLILASSTFLGLDTVCFVAAVIVIIVVAAAAAVVVVAAAAAVFCVLVELADKIIVHPGIQESLFCFCCCC